MATNKVILNNEVILDLSQDTVDESKVLQGVTFHKPNGDSAVGTLIGQETPTTTENWVFTFEDGTTETKKVVILNE